MEKTKVAFTLNGRQYETEAETSRSLLHVLREDLDLTGTKQGCDGGECGTCTVLLDGKATMSCLLPISRVAGREVVTIEGLSADGELHPLQEAFMEAGAVQCGFCTPGMILTAKALLDTNPNPSREDIVRRLSRNLCRCTGYIKIIDAIQYAAHLMQGGERRPKAQGTIGASVVRIDARDKVLGATRFAADIKMPGMLHSKALRSPHHRARILSIDTSEAKKMPGVEAVLTAQDIPGINCTQSGSAGWPLLAQEEAVLLGDPVALVAATSEEVAKEALSKVRVDYQPLPAVFNALEALKEDAPQLRPQGNLDYVRRLAKGNIEEGFAQADVVLERTYSNPCEEHAYLEPDASVAYLEEGRMIVRAPTQATHRCQQVTAQILGLSESQVRVVPTMPGGSFGGRFAEMNWLATPLLAYKTGKPVKMVFSREETLLYTKKRPASITRYRTGATKDGQLVAIEADILCNGGAYPSELDLGMGVVAASGPYRVPNIKVEGRGVVTNSPPQGALRGMAGHFYCQALESQMDIMAQELGIDPLEFRLKNIMELGDPAPWGQIMDESVGIKKTLEAIRPYWQEGKRRTEEWNKDTTSPIRRGVGLGCMWKAMGGSVGMPAHGYVQLHNDGRVEAFFGVNETGGTWTLLAQFIAEELKVPYNSIIVTGGDTDCTPEGVAAYSRGTYVLAAAVKNAAQLLKATLLKEGAQILEEKEDGVGLQDGYVVSVHDPSQRIPLSRMAAILQRKGVPLWYKGTFQPRAVSPKGTIGEIDPQTGQGLLTWMHCYATQMAEVEVNIQTGEVKVPRFIFALDSGTVLNPMNLEGQLEGAVLMGLGYTLMEGFVPGKSKNYKEYRIPTIRDAPLEIVHIFLQDPVASGPYGAKGAGENLNIATPAAILNAIAHAMGTRIYTFPATPERILAALKEAGKR
ncbi:MAG: molybdopterin-dependent oxidoreductase [Chloroflexi bacterium]|nr:molybdopterin-dependent oxidoreductase [Chloroflexota bacterium]